MYKSKHPLILIIAAILVASLAIFGLLFMIIPQPTGVDIDDSAGTELEEKTTFFTNYFFIQDYIGTNKQKLVFDNISDFVLSTSELESATDKNESTVETADIYTVDTNIDSYKELSPYPTISLELTISDKRKYQLFLYTDPDFSEKYIAVALKNLSTKKSALYINSDTDSYNNNLRKWAEALLDTKDYKFSYAPIS